MGAQTKSYKGLNISIAVILLFTFLMVFGLKHNPNFTPSQLVGKVAPAFTAPLSRGGEFSFDAKNQSAPNWTIINFWSSSCYVCRNEASELQDFYQSVSLVNKNQPQLLSINIQDDTSTIAAWQKNYMQTFPVVEDRKGLISVNYGVTGTPETFFVDTHHIVRYRIAGEVNKKSILLFTKWLQQHPLATEAEAGRALVKISAES